MFNSTILDVAIGLAFTFLAVSLATGAMVEAINSLLKQRSSTLLSGIKTLVNDPGFEQLALKLYQHAAINPRGPGLSASAQTSAGQANPKITAREKADAKKLAPSYIDPKQFADAMLDILGLSAASTTVAAPGPAAVTAFTDALASNDVLKNSSPQIKDFLTGLVQRTQGDLAKIRTELSQWFDTSMDRLSGDFKRRTQLYSVLIALGLCVGMNIDCLAVSDTLWSQPKLAELLTLSPEMARLLQDQAPSADAPAATSFSQKETAALEQLTQLNHQLPFGWPEGVPLQLRPRTSDPAHPVAGGDADWFWKTRPDWWRQVAGWVITALATLFGAPFWFDLLQTFIRLKGSGPSPEEKDARTAAAG